MTERISAICKRLTKADKFADVGCDHGYCARYMLDNNLCDCAYISDISAGSLKKARALLKKEIAEGRCVPVLADGMKGLPPDCGCVLIAGLGGEEIARILAEGYLPQTFVLQPMKNSDRVRAFLLERGCGVTEDVTFSAEGKYYDIISGTKTGNSRYSAREIRFGRENLKDRPRAFLEKLNEDRGKLLEVLSTPRLSEQSRLNVRKRIDEIEEVLFATQSDL